MEGVRVARIKGRAAMHVDRVEFHMRNGSVWMDGGDGGEEIPSVELGHEEYIVKVSQVHSQKYLGAALSFHTTHGRCIDLKGWGIGKKMEVIHMEAPPGDFVWALHFEGAKLVGLDTTRMPRS